MAQVDTDICNLALSHVGSSTVLQSMNETFKEAQQCKLHYDQCRREMLQRMNPSFAHQTVALSLQGQPPSTWRFSYAYPAGCLRILKVYNPDLFDRNKSALPPYKLATSANGEQRNILSDQEFAVADFIADVTSVSVFDHQFVTALSYLLAARIAPALVGGDAVDGLLNRHEFYLMQSTGSSKNESNEDLWSWRSEFERARD